VDAFYYKNLLVFPRQIEYARKTKGGREPFCRGTAHLKTVRGARVALPLLHNTLSPAEFPKRFGWTNDPRKAKLLERWLIEPAIYGGKPWADRTAGSASGTTGWSERVSRWLPRVNPGLYR